MDKLTEFLIKPFVEDLGAIKDHRITYAKEFVRNCPNCENMIVYKHYSNYRKGIRKNKVCQSCVTEIVADKMRGRTLSKKHIEKMRNYMLSLGDRNPAKNHNTRKILSEKASLRIGNRNPRFGCKLTKKHKDILRKANLGKIHSNDTKQKLSKIVKQWNANLSSDIKQKYIEKATRGWIESKFGISYDEYLRTHPKFVLYKNKVWKETRKQPVHSLNNHDKRGRAGIINAYQLDHKISMFDGFHKNISPETIGNIKNLRMIPWKENISKGSKSIYE